MTQSLSTSLTVKYLQFPLQIPTVTGLCLGQNASLTARITCNTQIHAVGGENPEFCFVAQLVL
jgi:hypothetical protein